MLVYFLNMGFPFFSRYIHLFKQTAAILYFCHFPYNVRFLLNIALTLLDVHYFESSNKSIVTGKMHKITYFFRKKMAAILYFVIFYNIRFY